MRRAALIITRLDATALQAITEVFATDENEIFRRLEIAPGMPRHVTNQPTEAIRLNLALAELAAKTLAPAP
jgi:hypothetical protein